LIVWVKQGAPRAGVYNQFDMMSKTEDKFGEQCVALFMFVLSVIKMFHFEPTP
jgi:hypothetical protein